MSPWWILLCSAVCLIGVTKSGFGSGVGLMIVPMTVLAMGHLPATGGETRALGFILPLLVVGDLIAVGQYRRLFDRQVLMRLLPGTAVGVLVGGWLLWIFHTQKANLLPAFIKTEIGFESVVLVGLHWYRNWREGSERKFRPSMIRSSAVGAFAGASSTLAHAAGPIIALHLLPQKLERQAFVGTCAVYFFLVNAVKLPVYYQGGQFHHDSFLMSLRALPLVFVGAVFGFWITRRMNDKLFSKIVYFVTFCLGWYLLYLGIGDLRHLTGRA